MLLKIGQLARQTGLTVRTLHHYDAIGLLRPSGRADNGYRMYDRGDIARLHRIQALRRLGLSLEEAGTLLAAADGGNGADDRTDLAALVARQVAQLNDQIEHATLLRDRLLRMQEDFAAQAEPDLREWLLTLELMAIFDKHLTPEETARWHAHGRDDRRVQNDAWKTLTADIQALIDAQVPVSAPAAQDAVRRWRALTDPHIKRDPQLVLKMDMLYRGDPAIQAATGLHAALIDYVTRAARHYGLALYARYLTPAQLESIRPRYLAQADHRWLALAHDLRAAMESGIAPTDAAAQAICMRWRRLFADCFGDDPDIRARILHAQASDPDLARGSSWDPPLRAYLRAGLAQLDAQEAGHA